MSSPTTPTTSTTNDRLHAVICTYFPHLADRVRSGVWGKAGAPYHFKRVDATTVRLIIEDPVSGDRHGVIGTSKADAVAKMDARLAAVRKAEQASA